MVEIRPAELADLDDLACLFDSYLQFYRRPSDLPAAAKFIGDRLMKQDSTIFVAIREDKPVGFVQLYPSFSSVLMRRLYILNDLFVSDDARHAGVATALIEAAENFGRQQNAVRLVLETEFSNNAAQKLYEKLGWDKDDLRYYYEKYLDA
jgi:ribosomal protein S18 acetylase RimI-like enzyme